MRGLNICGKNRISIPESGCDDSSALKLAIEKINQWITSFKEAGYTALANKPSINGVTVEGDKTSEEYMITSIKNIVDGSTDGSVKSIHASIEALGDDAFALGFNTEASGQYSFAECYAAKANGTGSHAEGGETKANGNYSHAEGHATVAIGTAAHTEGIGTIANGIAQHVAGAYNEKSSGGDTSRGAYVEIVGIGTADDARKNGRTLDWNGNEALAGSLTLGEGTSYETTITAAQLAALLAGSGGASGTASRFTQEFSTTANQSVFTFAPTGYTYNALDIYSVYINGLRLPASQYSKNDNVVTVTTPISQANQIVEIVVDKF